MLNISTQQTGQVTRVSLEGKLDSTTSAELESALKEQFAAGMSRLALDFNGVSYVSSAGLRVLLMAAKRLRKSKGNVALMGVQPNVREVLDLSGFTKIFTVVDNLEDATVYLTK